MYYLKKGNNFSTKNAKFCSSKEQANKFNTVEEAISFFELKFSETDNTYDYVVYDEKEPVYYINDTESYEDTNSMDILEILNQAKEISKKLTYRMNKLSNSISERDKEVVDIYHYIEFNDLGASDGYKAYKLLQNTLRARRKAKNEIKEVEAARSVFSTTSINKAIDTVVSERNEKVYNPRVMKDLFEK